MQESLDLLTALYEIGRAMVDCQKPCVGIGNDKANGITPRCLYFQEGSEKSGRGAAIVGINPGNSWSVEQQFSARRAAELINFNSQPWASK